jgi:hypothetical protein
MIAQKKLHLKRFGLLVIPVLLTLLMVTLTEKKASAVPLKPILNQVLRDIVEGVLNGDSPTQATPPDSQPSPNANQEEPDSSSGFSNSIPSTDPPIYPVAPPSADPVSPPSPLIYPPSLPPSSVAPTFVYSAPPASGSSVHPSTRPRLNASQNRGKTAQNPALRKRSKNVILKRQSHKVPVVHSSRRRA